MHIFALLRNAKLLSKVCAPTCISYITDTSTGKNTSNSFIYLVFSFYKVFPHYSFIKKLNHRIC